VTERRVDKTRSPKTLWQANVSDHFNAKGTPVFKAMANMPPRDHWPHGIYGFDIMRSEVADWLCKQPECRQEIFNWARRIGAITYDLPSHTWRGVNFNDKA
jgi:hypothetical protein